MFSPFAYDNSGSGGIAVLEVRENGRPPGAAPRFVPLRRTQLLGSIIGPLAELRVEHVYSFSREQYAKPIEAVYRFPLPGDAAVTGVRVTFGDVRIEAGLRRRDEAEAEYRDAVRAGKQAALASRESPDVFSLLVAGVRPDEEVRVETTYVQLARPEEGGWSLRIPLATAPRYVREDELAGRHAHGQPLALLRDPGHRFALDVTVRGAATVTSPTHDLDVGAEDGALRVRLVAGEVVPDRDCLLALRAERPERGAGLRVHMQDEGAGRRHFLALVSPPEDDAAPLVPREVVVLVDHSGSMTGPKWEAADWAVERFLRGLAPDERFALAVFYDRTHWFSRGPVPATSEQVDAAVAFLRGHGESGGTELGRALEEALELDRGEGELARHVLLLTDAQVGDAGRILRLADAEAARELRRRISVLCIDAAPNSFLVHELVRRGGGVARFLTSDPGEEDITTALEAVLAEWSRPVLTGLRLEVDSPGMVCAGHESVPADAGHSAADLGDLPAGRPVWVAGRLEGGPGSTATFRLTAHAEELAASSVGPEEARGGAAIAALYGARRLMELEFLAHAHYDRRELADQLARLGYDPDAILGGAEGGRRRVYNDDALRRALSELLAREALAYGLASSETSFVAVRQEAGERVSAAVPVAGALPAGWSDEFLWPPTGLGGRGFAAMGPQVPRAFAADAADLMLSALEARIPYAAAPRGVRPRPGDRRVYSGTPDLSGGAAVLYDSRTAPEDLPAPVTLRSLTVDVTQVPPGWKPESGIRLLLFVGDLAVPRARVPLVDLLEAGGARPLNVARAPGDAVIVVLEDEFGAWRGGAPHIDVGLGWE